jgi:hypothetical protein
MGQNNASSLLIDTSPLTARCEQLQAHSASLRVEAEWLSVHIRTLFAGSLEIIARLNGRSLRREDK